MSTTAPQSSGQTSWAQGNLPPAYSDTEEKHPGGPSPSYPSALGVAQPLVPSYGPQPVQYVVAAPYPMIAAHPKPNYPAPHSFVALVISVTAVCGLLDILSLAFGIPALLCALLSSFKASDGHYPNASKYAMAGFILTILNVAFTLLIGLMVASLVVGYTRGTCYAVYQYCYGFGNDCYYECIDYYY